MDTETNSDYEAALELAKQYDEEDAERNEALEALGVDPNQSAKSFALGAVVVLAIVYVPKAVRFVKTKVQDHKSKKKEEELETNE